MVRRRSTSPSATDRASALARPLLNDVHAIDHEGMPSLASGPNAPSSSPTPRRRRAAPWLGVAVALSAIGLAPGFACGSGDDGATAGQGGATATGASTGTGSGGAGSGGGGAGGVITTVTSKDGGKDDCPKPCGAAEVCSHGACVPATQCTTDDDCHNDTYCDAAGVCQPWDDRTPPYDPGCVNVLPPGIFSPATGGFAAPALGTGVCAARAVSSRLMTNGAASAVVSDVFKKPRRETFPGRRGERADSEDLGERMEGS